MIKRLMFLAIKLAMLLSVVACDKLTGGKIIPTPSPAPKTEPAPASAPILTSTPSQLTRYTGTFGIPQTWKADLDEGAVNGADDDADIWFQVSLSNERYITPQNGTRIAKVGTSPIELEAIWR